MVAVDTEMMVMMAAAEEEKQRSSVRGEEEEKSWSEELEQSVMETLKLCEERMEPQLLWPLHVSKCLGAAGFSLPSPDLGLLLVSNLCFAHSRNPSLWKFLEISLSSRLCSSLHVLSLLSSRVIPHRSSQPEAYRLFLELLTRYAFQFDRPDADACADNIIKSVDSTLLLSQTYNVHVSELGHAYVLFIFSVFVGLLDGILEDWGLHMTSEDKPGGVVGSNDHHQHMNVDSIENHRLKRNEFGKQMRRETSFLTLDVLVKLTENRKGLVLLRLVHLNMPKKFNRLLQRMQILEAHTLTCSNINSTNKLLEKLFLNIRRTLEFEYQLNKRQLIGVLINIGSSKSASSYTLEAGQTARWVSFDIFMENTMDAKRLPATSAADILAETIKTLHVFNRASWEDTFLALWLAALRLVQRERDPLEGPVPHLEARLSVLLSIVPLAILHVVKDEMEFGSFVEGDIKMRNAESAHAMVTKPHASKKLGLMSSLQALEQYPGLLCPPASIVSAANEAAAKAANFISSAKSARDLFAVSSHGGNMRHLILEACIARKLIDTSAYLWPGYASASVVAQLDSSLLQRSPWSLLMDGAPLTGSLVNALIMTPASSLAEVEKLYQIALNGSEEEKPAAAKILCGTSLSRGWNIQEHVVHFVVKLLSPPEPPNYNGSRSHLVAYMPMLQAVLFGASSVDTVHIISLHGLVPEVAASLMPLCEVFGSLPPTSSQKLCSVDEPSVYVVFSSAFLFLLRLWKFYGLPLEQCITGRGGAFGGELTLEYLLLLRNSHSSAHRSNCQDKSKCDLRFPKSESDNPIYIDFYPKLRAWYCQNKSCVASTLSGLNSGNPVHEVANKILCMVFRKISKVSTGNPSASSGSSMGGSPSSNGDDDSAPQLPAWEALEAIPLVLEPMLTACAHGRLSSRDLTTGLRDLVDFLPASLAAIISYYSAEVTRGIWKPVPMNGTDWPSPAAILQSVESEIDQILSGAGVKAPTCSSGTAPAMLPLPMAALVSLTITVKLDKSLEYIHAVAGPALENCASGCPWPSMPIIGSLWAQKARRWHDFIVVSCSRSVFRQNQDAVAQLLRSCFTSFLGSLDGRISMPHDQSGISGLLGHVISSRGGHPAVAPGFLYLRSCRTIQEVQYINDVIVELVAEFSRELASRCARTDSARLKSRCASLALATARAKEVAILGASLLCVAGGLQLVQGLYRETIPTWLLKARKEELGEVTAVSRVMEGYAMAYLLLFSGALIWGVGVEPPSWAYYRRCHVVRVHMDFLAEALEGNISLGCDPGTWKAYVSGFVGLVVSFAPAWIQEVKLQTLKKLAKGLRGWDECDLALALLERGGVAAMASVAELLNVYL